MNEFFSSEFSILESTFVVLELPVINEVCAHFSNQDMHLLHLTPKSLRVSACIKDEL